MPGVISVGLPDGSKRELAEGTTAGELAQSIGSRLAKAAVVATVDGREVDLESPLPDGATVAIVTADSEAGRDVLRHSTAHVMAQAVRRLWPGAKYAIGPVIENGFYYDFELPDGAHFSDDDLERIEAEMRAIIKEDQPFVRHEHDARGGPGDLRRPALQAGDHPGGGNRGGRGGRRRDGGEHLPQQRRVHRPVPGAARALDRPPRPLQADAGRRRLLARRREAGAAAADLRDGLGVREGTGRLPASAGGGRAARPPQARRGARPLQLPRGDRLRPRRLPPQGRDHPPPDGGVLTAAPRRGRATTSSTRRTSPRAPCSRSPATSTGSPTGCTRRWSSTAARSTTSSR